jgi:predicted GIY-YIG superfamily endonuclease
MYYVYILKHPTENRIYIGFDTDLRSGMKDHQSAHRDWKLAYEAYASQEDAREREQRLKAYGNVKQLLPRRIMRSLQMV